MKLEGIHHVTAITADAQRNVDFYAGVLGLRLVKKSVNQDDTSVYHLFYADERGDPGSDITFFEYPGLPRGRAGAGMIHRVVWRLSGPEALDFWARRLGEHGHETTRTAESLHFEDPEGLAHELRVVQSADEPLIAEHPEIPSHLALQGFDGVRAYAADPARSRSLLEDTLGFSAPAPSGPEGGGPDGERRGDGGRDGGGQGDGRRGDQDEGGGGREGAGQHGGALVRELRGERRGSLYVYDAPPAARGLAGAGTVHHVAWASHPEDHEAWHRRLIAAGVRPTPIIDRYYFRSIYFREPSGVLFEIATIGPGFTVDEPLEHLGEKLSLTPRYEHLRAQIEPTLTPLRNPRAAWVRD